MDFEGRQIGRFHFYITEKEAKEICKDNDPKRHWIPLLPKFKIERKVMIDRECYWISKVLVDGVYVWTLRMMDSDYVSEIQTKTKEG